MSVEKVTDNFKDKYPARMSDARFMTDYRPNCIMNKQYSGNMNSYEYRQKLISQAGDLIEIIDKVNNDLYGCSDCSQIVIPGSQYKQDCSGDTCKIIGNNASGIGIDQL